MAECTLSKCLWPRMLTLPVNKSYHKDLRSATAVVYCCCLLFFTWHLVWAKFSVELSATRCFSEARRDGSNLRFNHPDRYLRRQSGSSSEGSSAAVRQLRSRSTIILYRYRAPGVHKRQQSLLLHAVVQSDSSLVDGQQLICIKATDTRNSGE
jgi:hypothetical protein